MDTSTTASVQTAATLLNAAGQPIGQTTWSTPAPANAMPVPTPTLNMMDPNWVQQFAVNQANMSECITQAFYSAVNYPAAGTAGQLLFFNNIPGNPATITNEDTNMQAAGAFPAGTQFLLQGIGFDYLPGVTAASRFGAQSANGQLNDFYAVMRRGYVYAQIGSKPYLTWTNLLGLPSRSHINGVAAVADATTAGAALQSMVQVGFADGPVLAIRPLLIPSLQNFTLSVSYPLGAQAIPSADTGARLIAWIYGSWYRPVQ